MVRVSTTEFGRDRIADHFRFRKLIVSEFRSWDRKEGSHVMSNNSPWWLVILLIEIILVMVLDKRERSQ